MRLYLRLLLGLVRRALRSRNDLLMENLVLRQQLAVCARRAMRPRLRNEDRVFWSVVSRTWRPSRTHLRLVRPETVIRWHRTAWRRYWTRRSGGRRPGRPRISAELRDLIRRIARENRRWGAMRIVGELRGYRRISDNRARSGPIGGPKVAIAEFDGRPARRKIAGLRGFVV